MDAENIECKQCIKCKSTNIQKNGKTKAGKQKYKCKSCKKSFVWHPTEKTYSKPEKRLLSMLINLLELKPTEDMSLHEAFHKIKFERRELSKFKLTGFKERLKGDSLLFERINFHMLISIDEKKEITLTKFKNMPFDNGAVLSMNIDQVKIKNIKI